MAAAASGCRKSLLPLHGSGGGQSHRGGVGRDGRFEYVDLAINALSISAPFEKVEGGGMRVPGRWESTAYTSVQRQEVACKVRSTAMAARPTTFKDDCAPPHTPIQFLNPPFGTTLCASTSPPARGARHHVNTPSMLYYCNIPHWRSDDAKSSARAALYYRCPSCYRRK